MSPHILLLISLLGLVYNCLILPIQSDEKFYRDSNAAYLEYAEINLSTAPTAHVSVLLANDRYSGSTHPLYGTFVGKFSSSGPHNLGIFPTPGSSYQTDILLERKIGEVVGLWIENQNNDSLLFTEIKVRILDLIYEFEVPNMWIQKLDPTLEATTGDGYSPNSDLRLNSSSTYYLTPKSTYQYFDYTGLHNLNN